MKRFLPAARTTDIVVQELESEVLVYDMRSHRALCLNKTAGTVYLACDGMTSYAELTRRHGFASEVIDLAIAGLDEKGLLADTVPAPTAARGIGRREALRKAAMASAAALPLIAIVAAPSALHAASVCLHGSCTGPGTCSAPCTRCDPTQTACSAGTGPCYNPGDPCTASGICIRGVCQGAAGGNCAGLPEFSGCSATGTCSSAATGTCA
jgi:hypothetical protein